MKLKILFLIGFFHTLLVQVGAQTPDVKVYDEWYSNGNLYELNIGEDTIFMSGSSGLSVDIINSNAAVKVKRVFNPTPCTNGVYEENYFYTEIDQPFVGGTDQYEGDLVEVSCVARYVPQPKVFIPIDRLSGHPNVSLPVLPTNSNNAGHTVLMIRKANFYENSEDVCNLHGPWAEIVLNICSLSVWQHTYLEMADSTELWHADRIDAQDIYGAVYEADWTPEPRNEWLDTWRGVYYSNCGMWDWDDHSTFNSIAIIISEADDALFNEEDILGRAIIDKNMTGCILVKCRMFGWIVLENVVIPPSGLEPTVDVADNYVFLNWSGNYPEDYLGSQSNRMGTQYKPFNTMQQVEDSVPNTIVGVLDDGRISASLLGTTDLTVPMTYIPAAPQLCDTYSYIIDWDGTVNTNISELGNTEVKFTVFPNPFKDIVNVKFNDPKVIEGKLNIYDVVGNIVKSQNVKSQNINMEMSEISSGIYFLRLESDKMRLSKRIIKL